MLVFIFTISNDLTQFSVVFRGSFDYPEFTSNKPKMFREFFMSSSIYSVLCFDVTNQI